MPLPAPNTYPFDGSGTAVTNAIASEVQTLTIVNFRDYHYLVPKFAPFFAETLAVRFRADPVDAWVTLTEGIDYYPALQYIGASRATGKPVYGSISFNNLTLNGEIQLSYQTVGGEWTLDIPTLTEITANIIHNPRTTTWESIVNVPDHFPPLAHAWELNDMVGQAEILDALDGIEQAILAGDRDGDLLNHISNFSNPHRVSKQQVGLGKVQNYSPATIAETVAAQSSQLYVTPIGLKAYIDSLGLDQTLNFVSLQEVVDKTPVAKILTFDLLLEYMKLYGGGDTTEVPINTGEPVVLYPLEQGTYVKNQIFKVNTFTSILPGTINRIINITGTGTHRIPQGTGLVKITGRGGIGGVVSQPFVTKTEVLNGSGNGTFTIPAGGNVLSIRGQGAAGTSGRTKKYSLDVGSLYIDFFEQSGSSNFQRNTVTVNYLNSVNDNIEFGLQFTISANVTLDYSYTSGGVTTNSTWTGNVSIVIENNDNGSKHDTAYLTGGSNGEFWNKSTTDLTASHETLIFANRPRTSELSQIPKILPALIPTINIGGANNLTLVVFSDFRLDRQTGTVTLPGTNATTTISGAVRTYSGSSTLSSPPSRTDEVVLNPATSTIVSYSSPIGTELELIYQDYTATGLWEIKRYYSSKITNPSTGTSTLLEDTDGSIVALPVLSTGEFLSTRNSAVLEATTAIPVAYALQLVPSVSNTTRRVFEYKYIITGTEVTIRIVSELISSIGAPSQGPSASVSIMGSDQIYAGSQDNNTVPQTRTDEIILNTAAETVVTYDCPVGTSVVLNYNEPNSIQPINHSDTVWEIATSNTFNSTTIVEGTAKGKGSSFTLTTWKPTLSNVLINNTDYYARVKWIKSDASESSWSEVKRFTYSSGVTYPARDSELSRFCKGVDQWGTFADGTGGSYEKEISKNAVACGYTPPPPPSTLDTSVITNVQIISSLSTIPNGGTSVYTTTVQGTVTGRLYRLEHWYKQASLPDSAYQKSLNPSLTKEFTAGSGNVSILTAGVSHDGITSGAYNYKAVVSDVLNLINTKESNSVTVTFATIGTTPPPGTTTPPPITTTPPPSVPIVLTISTTHPVITVGAPEKITVSMSNGGVNQVYSIRVITEQTFAVGGGISGFTPFNFNLTTNSSGSATHTFDAGNNGSIPAGNYNTFAEVSGASPAVKSNIIARTFQVDPPVSTAAVTCNASPNSIGVGALSTVSANLSGFTANTSYTVKWWWTPPGGSRQTWNTYSGIQQSQSVTTNSSGGASATWSASNDGNQTPGLATFDVRVYNSSGVEVATPGGNNAGSITFVRNTSISFTSTLGTRPQISLNQSETLNISLTGGPVNSAVRCYMRGTFVSGNRSAVDTADTPFIINTNGTGSGTATVTAGNTGAIAAPSIWSRKAFIEASGISSSEMIAEFLAPITTQPPATANLILNLQSNLGTRPTVSATSAETLTITLANAAPYTTYSGNLGARYNSGASAGVDTSRDYLTAFSITTNNIGTGTATVTAGNAGGAIPGPSVWTRYAIINSLSNLTSAIMYVDFSASATTAPPPVSDVVQQKTLYHSYNGGVYQFTIKQMTSGKLQFDFGSFIPNGAMFSGALFNFTLSGSGFAINSGIVRFISGTSNQWETYNAVNNVAVVYGASSGGSYWFDAP